MVRHSEQEIFSFIVGDFRCAWDALAETPECTCGSRGNFMFALQATVLLEWLCRLCVSDPAALQDFFNELQKIEPKYFTLLDDEVEVPRDFKLPGPQPPKHLLSALYDLIRNGNAHEYQNIVVTLTDGRKWAVGLLGVKHLSSLSVVAANRSNSRHLSYFFDSVGDLMLIVHPGVLFLDLCEAAQKANLLSRGLAITPLFRPRKSGYRFNLNQLEQSLQKGGHPKS